jgi:cytochrome c-type biogenesis protein CcmE
MTKKRWGLLAGVVIVLSGFGYLLSGSIGDNLVYFLTPDELLAQGPAAYDRPIRLGGQVVPGTVRWDAAALDLRFQLRDEDGVTAVDVHARKAPPQMFREGMGVVVEGRWTAAGIFESTNLMVKHSNEYRAPEEGHDPNVMYRSLIRDGG